MRRPKERDYKMQGARGGNHGKTASRRDKNTLEEVLPQSQGVREKKKAAKTTALLN